MTTEPDPDSRHGALHARLTVVRATGAERQTVASSTGAVVLGPADLAVAAQGHAAQRWSDRMAARARLDSTAARLRHDASTASSRLEHLEQSRDALRDGAQWCERSHAELSELRAAVDSARQDLEDRQLAQRTAAASLDRVLEQRAAASAAIADADRELAELAGTGLDETELRRELEVSGGAVRAARARHAQARARLEELTAERDELERQTAALLPELRAEPHRRIPAPGDVDRVQAALAAWMRSAELGMTDPQAALLADAFDDLHADLAEIGRSSGPRPHADALVSAEAQVTAAARELARLDAELAAQALTPADRAELEEAHTAVERAAAGAHRRLRGASARRRVEAASAAERALLERFGFDSYLEVVLSGGRAPAVRQARLVAERALLVATAARDELRAALQPSADLAHLESERARLVAHAVEVLGVDPGDAPQALLRAHPQVSSATVEELRSALAAVGVHPVAVDLATAAAAWLADHHAEATVETSTKLAAIDARRAGLEVELSSAQHALDDAAEQLELAVRSVGTLEAELAERLGEDIARVQRFAAAEELRSQVKALAATLGRAEKEARRAVDAAATEVAAAERAFDRAHEQVSEVARTARQLAGELPIDQRPPGDPLGTLLDLATRLRQHLPVIEDEISAAADAAAAAARLVTEAEAEAEAAGPGPDPWPDDVADGLRSLLGDGTPGGLSVLDDPVADHAPGEVASELRERLLEIVVEQSASRPVVLLTEDPSVLGWAIELPVDVAAVAPLETVLNLLPPRADTESTGSSLVERSRT